ncbi:MAG: 5' nucleotidase, NT5C type [Chloroflexota bacterium]
MTLGFDIDGVLADFITPFLSLLEIRTGSGPIDPASVTDPNFTQHPFLTKETVIECMEAASYDPDFWRLLAPLPSPEQWRALDQLSRDHQVVFITHRWVRDTYDIHRVTCDWLRRHGIADPVVHFTQEKKSVLVKELNVELFVDDRRENCEDVANFTDAAVFMPHRPYNQSFHHPKVRRIQQLDELFDHLSIK